MGVLGTILAWMIPVLILIGTVVAFSREKERKSRRTEAEYQRDLAESRGSLLSAGVMGFQKVLLTDEKKAAIEYLQDEEQGATKTGAKGDDKERTEGNGELQIEN